MADAAYEPDPYTPDPGDDTVKCPHCGKMDDPDAKFCDQCGGKMAAPTAYTADADETIKCPVCGKMNDDDARFCDQCGVKLAGRTDVSESAAAKAGEIRDDRLPREGLVRAMSGCEIREAAGNDAPGPGTLHGHLAVFNQWSEINSLREGHFMERLAPGAFAKTITEGRDKMRVTFNHGKDPSLGDKVLGPIADLAEDEQGVRYEVPLLDTQYNRELAPGLKAGLYGSSFRFNVVSEDLNRKATRSDSNPQGLPERTIREVRMQEFGPVTFPAYPGATAAMRSLTDEFTLGAFLEDPGKLQRLLQFHADGTTPEPEAAVTTPHLEDPGRQTAAAAPTTPVRRKPKPVPPQPQRSETPPKMTRDERRERLTELETWIRSTNETYEDDAMPAEVKVEWEKNNSELDQHRGVMAELEARTARVTKIAEIETQSVPGTSFDRAPAQYHQINRMSRAEVHDLNTLTRTSFLNPEAQSRELTDRAERALEFASFPHDRADQDASKANVERLLKYSDSEDREIARRVLVTGSPQYRSAFNKYLAGKPRNAEEDRAMSLGTTTAGGFAVVYELDPTFIRTSNLSVNPFRAICRKVTIAGTNEWRGVTSAGIVAAYGAEAAESSDNSPTLAQPAAIVQRASAFVPFSIEAGQDITGLQGELAVGIQDAKDDLEALEFTTGVGTTVHPQGILVGATSTTATTTTGAFVIADMYKLEQALKPRSRPRAVFVANRAFYNDVRAFDTAGGAGMWYGYPNPLAGGLGNNVPTDGRISQPLMGYAAYEDSAMVSVLTTGGKVAVFGDFNAFVIVDRIGLDVEIIPHLFGSSNRYPTGQRGLFAYWRNTSKVVDATAFQVLLT